MIFIKGLILGFAISAPVGPMGVLCIRRTLSRGIINGIFSGIGIATADAIYAAIAGLGVSTVSVFLMEYRSILQLIGGLIMVYLGYLTFFTKPEEKGELADYNSHIKAFTTSFFLTMTNFMTIIAFAAIFAAMGVGGVRHGHLRGTMILVSGVFSGALLWWLLLTSTISLFRNRVTAEGLVWINRISGLVIVGFGLASIFFGPIMKHFPPRH